jgi:hypothetical protein
MFGKATSLISAQFFPDLPEARQSGSRDYHPFPNIRKNQGNCNTITTGLLVGAGVKAKDIKKSIDPIGFNPGIGIPLPEMIQSEQKSYQKK